jgi:hypothetical protein
VSVCLSKIEKRREEKKNLPKLLIFYESVLFDGQHGGPFSLFLLFSICLVSVCSLVGLWKGDPTKNSEEL